jgi:nucleotide-binding universal stress UspA family protein
MEAVMAGTILCGVTDSPEGRAAAQVADALSARLGLRLVLAHVVDGIPVGADESLTALQGRTGGERLLTVITGDLRRDQKPELRLAHGDRAERLAQFAAEEGADLIVVGSRRQGLLGRKLRCTLARESGGDSGPGSDRASANPQAQ